MYDLPDTRDSLLVRLQDPADHAAWAEFIELYRPAVYRLARRRGLQAADAEDLTQQVFLSISQAIERWDRDPSRGRFRGWLMRIAKNATLNALTRTVPKAAPGETGAVERLQEQPENDFRLAADLEIEYRRQVFRSAMRQVRGEVEEASWDVFWTTTVLGESVEQAACRLGKTAGAIYAVRCRIMRKLRKKVRDYRGEEE